MKKVIIVICILFLCGCNKINVKDKEFDLIASENDLIIKNACINENDAKKIGNYVLKEINKNDKFQNKYNKAELFYIFDDTNINGWIFGYTNLSNEKGNILAMVVDKNNCKVMRIWGETYPEGIVQ